MVDLGSARGASRTPRAPRPRTLSTRSYRRTGVTVESLGPANLLPSVQRSYLLDILSSRRLRDTANYYLLHHTTLGFLTLLITLAVTHALPYQREKLSQCVNPFTSSVSADLTELPSCPSLPPAFPPLPGREFQGAAQVKTVIVFGTFVEQFFFLLFSLCSSANGTFFPRVCTSLNHMPAV